MKLTIEQIMTLLTIGLAALTAVAGAIAYLLNRPQAHAATNKTLSETVQVLSTRVSQLETERKADHQRILKLEAENHTQKQQGQRLEHLISICVSGLQSLANQLLRQEIEPEWVPPAELDQWITTYLRQHL